MLVTGHTGFIGGWLATALVDFGSDVHGIGLAPSTHPSLFDWNTLADRIHHQLGDLRQSSVAERAVRQANPEVVFHLAAQAIVRRGLREPVETFETNVMGTVHLLEALRTAPSVRAIVVVTSDKCYEEAVVDRGYRETDPLGGRDPYSASKGCQEIVAHAYRRSYLPGTLATARLGNVIGGGDWSEARIVPDAVRAIVEARPVQLRNPHSIRPWQHVLDPLHGCFQLAQALFLGQAVDDAWNFGPCETRAVTVSELVEAVHRAWGQGTWVSVEDPDARQEAATLRLDTLRARQQLMWQSSLTLDQAVGMTVDWYRQVLNGESDPFSLTCLQISDHARRSA